jgi:AcrR family transcriptional regulator
MPRISADTVALHRELVVARVLEAFASLMVERSYDAITMAAIAERAVLGRTAIYHHFPDKESVVVAFATRETERYLDELRGLLDEEADPPARLRRYLRHHLEARDRFHMGLGPQLSEVLPRSSAAAIREHVVAVQEVLHGILADGAADGSLVVDDVAATASLVHAGLAPRHLPAQTIEAFVLRAVGAAGQS